MRPLHLVLIGALVVVDSLCYVGIEIGTESVPPLRFAGLRAGLGGLTLLAGAVVLRAPIMPPRDLWPGIFGLAVLGTTVGYSAMFLSPHATGAGIASVVGNTGPLLLVLFGTVFLGERMTRARLTALGLAAGGVALIAMSRPATAAAFGVPSVVVPLGAAAAAAGATVLLKQLRPGRHVLRVAMWQLLLGAIPILVVSQVLEGPATWTSTSLQILLFLGVAGTAGAVSVWYWLVQREQLGRLGILMFAIPVLGVAASWVLLGDEPAFLAKIGIALALIGLLQVARTQDSDREAGLLNAQTGVAQ